MLAGMRKIATAIALTGTLTLAGCGTDTETETTPTTATTPTTVATVDHLTWSTVNDFYNVIHDAGLICDSTETGTNQETGWGWARCNIGDTRITASMRDNPKEHAEGFIDQASANTQWTFVVGENWSASCLGYENSACWSVVGEVKDSELLTRDLRAVSAGNDRVYTYDR